MHICESYILINRSQAPVPLLKHHPCIISGFLASLNQTAITVVFNINDDADAVPISKWDVVSYSSCVSCIG